MTRRRRRQTAAFGLEFSDFLGLLLRADHQDHAALFRHVLDEIKAAIQLLQGLLQVDDENTVALREDETLHLWVPTLGLVTEMYASLEQLLHLQVRH